VHLDIKPENIFIGPGRVYKIGDFGCARFLNERIDHGGGDGHYIAREVMQEDYLAQTSADIFSLGVTACELAFGSDSLPNCVQEIQNGTFSSEKFSQNYIKLIGHMVQLDPRNRPKAGEINLLRFSENSSFIYIFQSIYSPI
jgi:NIMA (never in mitosis gene a)-related kinase